METTNIVILILAGVCAALLVKVFLRKDSARCNKHKGAGLMAGSLKAHGMNRIPAILMDYSQYDWQGIGKKFESIYELFQQGEDVVLAELSAVFKSVLKETVKTEEGRAYVAAVLAEATKATLVAKLPTAIQAAAPVLAAVALAQ
jgi:hypothetical protein